MLVLGQIDGDAQTVPTDVKLDNDCRARRPESMNALPVILPPITNELLRYMQN